MPDDIQSHQSVPWGKTLTEDVADYYVLLMPVELARLTHVTLSICTRCGVPVYSEQVHNEFHRKLDAARDAVSDTGI